MASFLSNLSLDSPLALYSIPVVWFTSFYPHLIKFTSIDNAIGFNNTLPRTSDAKSTAGKVPVATQLHFARLEGAHQNGTENLPIYFAAILAGHIAGLDNRYLNVTALSYVAARLAYNTVYIYFNDVAKGWIRSGLYFFALSYPLRLLFKAAGHIASK